MQTAVKERPILFSGPMVRAILEDRKTQTRRRVKLDKAYIDGPVQVIEWREQGGKFFGLNGWDTVASSTCPYGSVGDRLWVREAFYIDLHPYDEGPLPPSAQFDDWRDSIYYRADGECCEQIPECQCADVGKPRWRRSIHMPRWASRITLEITGVRVERLQDISAEDAIAEGAVAPDFVWEHVDSMCREEFRELWQSINGPDSWAANPWVWCLEFKRV